MRVQSAECRSYDSIMGGEESTTLAARASPCSDESGRLCELSKLVAQVQENSSKLSKFGLMTRARGFNTLR